MHDAPPAPGLTRRRLLAAGGAGVAVLLAPGAAQAAPLSAELRRTTWAGLADGRVTATVAGRSVGLELVEVADLPIAAAVPALRGHDGAFALRFAGPPGLPSGTHGLHHPELGAFALFVSPVGAAGAAPRYEAVVDRTVRIAGVNEEGVPAAVVPPARAAAPAATAPAPLVTASGAAVPVAAPRRRPRLRTVAVRRGGGRRGADVDLVLTGTTPGTVVRAVLLRRGHAVARAAAPVRHGDAVRLRLRAGRALGRGRYELALVVVDREGRITRFRRQERLA
ncbi:hypothetical protein [Patulibacter sp. SYSU D01012]|uniref:DUF6916 family protein n=1 Tax=Patulibacter sp. SYSU D01012 TaxID=2817381 RepID=UPI001B313888|nr:hypothetical protein [Patulibacter sp. SYSU D01012]